ncbi:MAG TPA: glycosyltransferase family 2 protein [Pyrinomonadaceae bacterium]|jgi:glycosyltransferase involved in cell wall biosynthesis|nr:glycosyltransferase family 2 protein [Pyrinomonadaceae bacterium]
MATDIDVLMCAYNEAPHIARALESLRSQTVDPESFRIIFVDNASKDETRKVVEENSGGLNLEYVYEARPGLNAARNAGYEHAQAPYVAHLDADAKAAPGWIENIRRVIRDEQPDLTGGPIFPYYITEKPAWFQDAYNMDYKGDAPRPLEEGEFLNGSNMVWRRSVVEHLGRFNAKLGLMARGLARGDETSLMIQAREEIPNFKAFYHPEIIVYHLTRPETFSLWYWARRSFSQGSHDREVWNTKRARQRPRYLRLAQFVGAATLVGAKGVRALVQRDRAHHPYWKNYCYELMMPDVYRLGAIWGLARRNNSSGSSSDSGRAS